MGFSIVYSVHEVKQHNLCKGGVQKLAKSNRILSCKINFEIGKSATLATTRLIFVM